MTGLDFVSRLKKMGLYSIKGRLLSIDFIQIWKAFHSDNDVGLSDIFEYARNIRTRGHAYKVSIPKCRKDVKKRSFGVRCVNIWNSIPAEAVASNNVETLKAQLDRFWGIGYMNFRNAIEKSNSSRFSLEETQPALSMCENFVNMYITVYNNYS